MTNKPQIGLTLRTAMLVSAVFAPLARPVLRRRLAKGKEDPDRWGEKLGHPTAQRPNGPLVWMHGVGVGEVMALRGLIAALSDARPDLRFLVTSSARSSGDVFARNLPPNTQHQYLPLDMPAPVKRFLDHWTPDLAVWSDQEIWPRLTVTCARRGIPQALVAARLTKKSTKVKSGFGDAFGNLYRLLDTRHAQDDQTAASLQALMGDKSAVHVTGSLKAAGAPLRVDDKTLTQMTTHLASRKIWLLASSHAGDEAIALKAHGKLRETVPDALLIIAPRDVKRAGDIAQNARNRGLTVSQRSETPLPDASDAVYIADTYGELGVWYRIAPIALIGGTFDATQGHNPWEPATLGCAILHGPQVANFALDFKALNDAHGCRLVQDAPDIVAALQDPATLNLPKGATIARAAAAQGLIQITDDLLGLLAV